VSPRKIVLRAYNVGFGDCFLLTFHYAKSRRRVLIDFGSTAPPAGAPVDYMLRVARDIAAGGRLHAVVATHRHRDHINGFGARTGKIIASLAPEVVIQPWTEDPAAAPDGMGGPGACRQGVEDMLNRSAVRCLLEMGRKGRAVYVHGRSPSGLEELLPGVDVFVLGPPTLEQSAAIRRERPRDAAEFWQFRAFWEKQGGAPRCSDLFPHAPRYAPDAAPAHLRWFLTRARRIRVEQTKEFVRALDHVLNNTSVILLFRIGDFSLLFPGDAQIENWSWSLGQSCYRELLRGVNVYKVGHHGSFNATPRSLWKLFAHRTCKEDEPGRLLSLLSTRSGRHGSEQARTEVPRRTLVETLARESNFFCTQSLPKSQLYREFEFTLDEGDHDE
jgi:glyoxylase-like metal-dependent hydrolase (beta-lactamase superfamily II)